MRYSDIYVAAGGRGQVFQPGQRARITEAGQQWAGRAIKYAGGLAIDATTPFDVKWAFDRPLHHRVDLKKWFTEEEIQKAKSSQWPYHEFLSELGI